MCKCLILDADDFSGSVVWYGYPNDFYCVVWYGYANGFFIWSFLFEAWTSFFLVESLVYSVANIDCDDAVVFRNKGTCAHLLIIFANALEYSC